MPCTASGWSPADASGWRPALQHTHSTCSAAYVSAAHVVSICAVAPTRRRTACHLILQAVSHDTAEYEHPLMSRLSSLEPLAHSQSLKRQMAEAANRKEVSLEHHAVAPQLPVDCFVTMSWDVPGQHVFVLTLVAEGCLGFTGSILAALAIPVHSLLA